MEPERADKKRQCEGEGEKTHSRRWVKRIGPDTKLEWAERVLFEFEVPKSPKEIYLRNWISRRHLPLDDQIRIQVIPLRDEGLLGPSFYDPIASLPRLRFYELLRDSVGTFLSQGQVLYDDLRLNLGRWDPNLKAAVVTAKGFADIARLICMDELVKLGNKLEAACLSGIDPVVIYHLCYLLRDFFLTAFYKLTSLMVLVRMALSAPPAAAGPS